MILLSITCFRLSDTVYIHIDQFFEHSQVVGSLWTESNAVESVHVHILLFAARHVGVEHNGNNFEC